MTRPFGERSPLRLVLALAVLFAGALPATALTKRKARKLCRPEYLQCVQQGGPTTTTTTTTMPAARPRQVHAEFVLSSASLVTVTVSVQDAATMALQFDVFFDGPSASICSSDFAVVQGIRRASLCEASPSAGCCTTTPLLGCGDRASGSSTVVEVTCPPPLDLSAPFSVSWSNNSCVDTLQSSCSPDGAMDVP
jgi:hypothetical protein